MYKAQTEVDNCLQHRMLSQNKKSVASDIKLRKTDLSLIACLKEICPTGKDSLLTCKTVLSLQNVSHSIWYIAK